MSRYDLHYNYDDVFIRSVITGFINLLHTNIGWYNQLGREANERRAIEVPFYFSTTGQERYLQDNFGNDIVRDPNGEKAEGPYNKIPRGSANLTGLNISTVDIVNKYVRVERKKMDPDGSMKTYSTEAFWIPLTLEFEVEVLVDTMIDQLKCTEMCLKTFYKAKHFHVDVASIMIQSYAVFNDSQQLDRSIEFNFDDKKKYAVKFDVEVHTAIPAFTDGSDVFKGQRIDAIELKTHIAAPGNLANPQNLLGYTQLGWTGPVDPAIGTNLQSQSLWVGSTGSTG